MLFDWNVPLECSTGKCKYTKESILHNPSPTFIHNENQLEKKIHLSFFLFFLSWENSTVFIVMYSKKEARFFCFQVIFSLSVIIKLYKFMYLKMLTDEAFHSDSFKMCSNIVILPSKKAINQFFIVSTSHNPPLLITIV